MQGNVTDAVNLSQITTYLFDLDGVLWRGGTAIEGAIDAVKRLQGFGKRCIFCTNNSSHTSAYYVEKLGDMGLHVNESDMLTSSWVTAHYLSGHFTGPFLAYVIGEEGIYSSLQKIGARIVPDSDLDSIESVDCVVVGMDRGFNYTKLLHAQRLIGNGALFIATNRDGSYPVEDGVKPGAGSIVAAVEAATAVTPVTVGKPRPVMVDLAIQRLNLKPGEVAFVGDRLDTDIVCARRAGITAICVLTGVTTKDRAERARGELRPHYIFETLTALCTEALIQSPSVIDEPQDTVVAESITEAAEPDDSTFTIPTDDNETFAEASATPTSNDASENSLTDDIDQLFDESKDANTPGKEDAAQTAPDEFTFPLPDEEDEAAAQITTSPATEENVSETSLSGDIDQLFKQSEEQSEADTSDEEKSFDLDTVMSAAEGKEPELPASQRPPAAKEEPKEIETTDAKKSFDLDKGLSTASTEEAKPSSQNLKTDAKKGKAGEEDFDWKLD